MTATDDWVKWILGTYAAFIGILASTLAIMLHRQSDRIDILTSEMHAQDLTIERKTQERIDLLHRENQLAIAELRSEIRTEFHELRNGIAADRRSAMDQFLAEIRSHWPH